MFSIDRTTDALIIIDVQNDFCPGGQLAVSEGDKVVPVINSLIPKFVSIFTTQDWHPANHFSFKTHGGAWPPHCIANTEGAQLHPDLRAESATHILKGTVISLEAYSAFQGTSFKRNLKKAGIKRLFITGLATDYCVRATTLDALEDGFEVFVVSDSVRGVEISMGDSKKALAEMKKAGAIIIASKDIQQ
jgi:nicotinamidase/pyrazinamidase